MPNKPSIKTLTVAAIVFVSLLGANQIMAGVDDIDDDGVSDADDNCVLVANSLQRDTDGDGVGNYCDPDLNNDWIVDNADRIIMDSVFFTSNPDADLNGDGHVNFLDLGLLKSREDQTPGPPGTIIWADSVDGFWDNPNNWQPPIVPTEGVTAIIDVMGSVTVSLDGDSASLKTLILNENFHLTDATFAAMNQIEASGTITMTGSVIENTVIVPSQAGEGLLQINTGSANHWKNLTLGIDSVVANGGSVEVTDGLTINSDITINAPTSPTGLVFTTSQTVDGSGNIIFNGTGNSVLSEPRLFPSNGTTLTIGSGLTISGGNGTIGQAGATLVLNSDIEADVSGETLVVTGAPWSSSGSLGASNGGTLRISGELDNGGNALTIDTAGGNLNVVNGTSLLNATLNGTPGSDITLNSGSFTFQNLVLSTDLVLNNGAIANVSDGLTVNDNLTIIAPSLTTGLQFVETQTLSGSGSVLIDGTGNGVISEPRLFPLNGTTLTIGPGLTISGGNGTIGQAFASLVLNGEIEADVSGETLVVTGAPWSGSGSLGASNGGTLQISGELDNGGNALTLDTAAGNLNVLNGTSLLNATLNGTPGTDMTLNSGSYTFQDLVLNTDLVLNNGAIADVSSGLTVNDSLTINAPSSPTGLHLTTAQTLDGNGTITFNGFGNPIISEPRILPAPGATVTMGPNLTINGGGGSFGSGSAELEINGLISASTDNLRVLGSVVTNQGLLEAINGNTLTIDGSTIVPGTLHAGADSVVSLTSALAMSASSHLLIDIGGPQQVGRISAPFALAEYDGMATISAVDGYMPNMNESFLILQHLGFMGNFDTVNSVGLGVGESFVITFDLVSGEATVTN